MNLLTLVTRDVRANPGHVGLTMALTALTVALMVMVWNVTEQVSKSLTREAEAIDLVVGAKGSPLQLVLSSIYHLDVPPGSIHLADTEMLRDHPLVKRVIPIALADTYQGYRIVGAPPDYATIFGGRLAHGHWGNGKAFEVVLGAEVAREWSGTVLGSTFVPLHGLNDGPGAGAPQPHTDVKYTVTGILSPTGTVLDRSIVSPIDGVWRLHQGIGRPGVPLDDDDPFFDPEITAALVQYKTPEAATAVQRVIQQQTALMSAVPVIEMGRFTQQVGLGRKVLNGVAILLAVIATAALWVGLVASLKARQAEIAVFRLLGASRAQVWSSVMLEALLFGGVGALAGVTLAHVAIAVLGQVWAEPQRLSLAAWHFIGLEAGIVVGACVISAAAGAWPAWRASRVNVSRVLAQTWA